MWLTGPQVQRQVSKLIIIQAAGMSTPDLCLPMHWADPEYDEDEGDSQEMATNSQSLTKAKNNTPNNPSSLEGSDASSRDSPPKLWQQNKDDIYPLHTLKAVTGMKWLRSDY